MNRDERNNLIKEYNYYKDTYKTLLNDYNTEIKLYDNAVLNYDFYKNKLDNIKAAKKAYRKTQDICLKEIERLDIYETVMKGTSIFFDKKEEFYSKTTYYNNLLEETKKNLENEHYREHECKKWLDTYKKDIKKYGASLKSLANVLKQTYSDLQKSKKALEENNISFKDENIQNLTF